MRENDDSAASTARRRSRKPANATRGWSFTDGWMVILDADHPNIAEFVRCTADE